MTLVNPPLPTDGTTADAADIATPIQEMANAINGNLEDENIKAGAAIATSKLANDAGITTAKLADDAVTAAKMLYGLVRGRQGSTTGDNAWTTAGANNTDTSAKNTFIQVGSSTSSNAGAVTVTFPNAFTVAPLVYLAVLQVGGTAIPNLDTAAPTTTDFKFSVWSGGGARINGVVTYWLAIGQ
jgi:hypothetical protein